MGKESALMASQNQARNPEHLQRVLVVIMNNQQDWRLVRDQGWYRIPVARAPQQLAADWLAFYHTKAFAEEKWSIRHYAAVQRIRLTTRCALLPEQANHPRAQDPYYKIELGPLLKLAHPVLSASLRRITFIPTTLARLQTVSDVRELWEGRATAEQLWEALQAVGVPAQPRYRIQEQGMTYDVDLAVFCQQAKLAISCEHPLPVAARERLTHDGWRCAHYETRIVSNPWRCAHQIRRYVNAHGGPQYPPPQWNEKEP